MYQLKSTTTDFIGPRKAQELFSLNTFEGQRPLSIPWVQYLASNMAAGTFTKGSIAVTTVGRSDTQYLMNGQHQLKAIELHGKPAKATIDYYHCDDLTDMWHLFAQFDVHRIRTEGHIMKAARGSFENEELRGVPYRTLSIGGTVLTWLGGGTKPAFNSKPMSKSNKADLVEKYASDVIWLSEQSKNAPKAVCPTVAIAAVMIATHRTSPKKADGFWPSVLGGFDLVRHSPQWHLHNIITNGITKCINYGGGGKYFKAWALCVSWWNAYASGDNRKSVKVESIKTLPDIHA